MTKPTDDDTESNVISITGTTSPTGRRGQGHDENGLTVRQDKFAHLVAEGSTLTDAYRGAFQTKNMKPSTIWTKASQLASRAKVQTRVNALVKVREATALTDDTQTRLFVREQLYKLALEADTSASRIRALELLGKHNGVQSFSDTLRIEDMSQKSSADLRVELETRLKSMATKAQ